MSEKTQIQRDHFRQALGQTPFQERIAALSQTQDWTTWNTYQAARVLDNLSAEYFAVRSSCAVMDLTPMEKYRISGPQARAYLDRLLTRNLSKLRPGRVTYVIWCNDEGQLIDDGTLFQISETEYRLCAQHHQLDWLLLSAEGYDVNIEVETHDIAALAVQGPSSYSVLKAAGIDRIETLKPFDVARLSMGEIDIEVSRTGYTGDLGYELWLDPADALTVWDALFAVKPLYDIRAMGLDALEMVRIEAGFIMPGFDFNTAESTIRDGYTRTPYEVGLGWVVDLDKGHFTGRKALRSEQSKPAKKRLTKLVIDGNKPVGDSFVYAHKTGESIGEVKCSVWSPLLKANLALADIELRDGKLPKQLWVKIDYQRELKWHSTWAECHPQTKPFYNPKHRSLTPPERF